MSFRTLMVTMLGLAGFIVPARATFSYQTNPANWGVPDDLSSSGLIDFSSSGLMTVGGVTNDAYLDPATQVEFLAFNGSAHDVMSVSGGTLVARTQGDIIEAILPAGVYGFAVTLIDPVDGFANVCFEPGAASFNNGSNCIDNPNLANNTPTFLGGINDTPLNTFTTAFIGPGSGSPTLQIQNFEIATQASLGTGGDATPEGSTAGLMGAGLVAIGALRRRLRPR